MKIEESNNHLINDLVALIENGKNQLAYAANATMTLTYWNIGKRINDEILDNQRAEYGKNCRIGSTTIGSSVRTKF